MLAGKKDGFRRAVLMSCLVRFGEGEGRGDGEGGGGSKNA